MTHITQDDPSYGIRTAAIREAAEKHHTGDCRPGKVDVVSDMGQQVMIQTSFRAKRILPGRFNYRIT